MKLITCNVPDSLYNALVERVTDEATCDHVVSMALSRDLGHHPTHTLFQVSTSAALVEGLYQGAVRVSQLLRHGNFGLGTFIDLDGEMVVLEGVCYRVTSDGVVTTEKGDRFIPYDQQTLGVALPWGKASCLVRPNEKTLSISGDGGFLFSATELETAVRLKLNLVHMVWIDGTYEMVAVQEQPKYKRTSGVDFGPVDVVKYAEAFGAVGFMVDAPDQIGPTLKKAFEIPGPVLIGIRVDYRDNHKLFEKVHEHLLN
jgi:hypothetical protein